MDHTERGARAREHDALEEAADDLLARKALQTLAEEGGAPRACLADVLADIGVHGLDVG